ncbi:YdaU family protein [Burkholderia contaminans]|uniref:YdaU family protein n=1 Tax=Burkholderia contaminans TaxID=488447 RepID=UPI002655C3F9|nr:YdaU family protein [Burkholderia contaminans]MDN7790464.1 YdaU family protein [Burkholderia contaminans]
MIFYKRFPGDYTRDTIHLSMIEDGAYGRLMDFYYSSEKPLPPDSKAVYRIARATDRAEQRAVDSVLSQFFDLTDEGYRQKRIDIEIEKAQPKATANRENGKKGGRPRKNPLPDNPLDNPPQNPMGFQSETQPEPSGQPALVNHSHSHIKNLSGGGTAEASGCVRAKESPPAAALLETLAALGVDAAPDDARVAAWAAAGVTKAMLVAAISEARQRRAKANSPQPVNVGFLDAIVGDVLAARATPSAATGMTTGDWWRSWSGIVAKGTEFDVTQRDDEPDMDFRLRVYRAAGDGPWWDELDRRFRNTAGPVTAGEILENGR